VYRRPEVKVFHRAAAAAVRTSFRVASGMSARFSAP
jgi:hypothetical protein